MISACIIAWNAEQHIISCLDSIKDYCSEINIALDTKTTDRTGTVIAAWGDTHNHISVNVYSFEWVRDSFADARNFIGAKATKPWSFVIDADERATNHVQPLDGYDAYTVKVVGTINGKINTIFPSPRLYKTNIGVTFRRSTHEDNWESFVGKTVVDCDMMLESVEKTEEALIEKTQWLLERAKRELVTESWNQYLYGQIGTYYQTLGDYTESNKWLHRAMFTDISNNMKAQGAIRIFINYQKLDNFDCDNAMFWLHLSLALCPEQLQARYILYQIFKNDNKPELAEAKKQEIISVGRKSKLPYDLEFSNITF